MSDFFGINFEDVFSIKDIFTDDLRKSSSVENPRIIPEFDLVYVLSGRSTALGKDADKLDRDFDTEDDLERLKEGIRIADEVNALRAKKRVEQLTSEDRVTPIFYNGRAIHNSDLKIALEQGIISYPKELFIIKDIAPENTIGQVRSFKEFLSSTPNKYKNVAVVSSAYHGPRVLRTIGNESPLTMNEDEDSPIQELNLFFFGVHKNEQRKGIIHDLKGEHRAIINYSSGDTPSIARVQSTNTFFTDTDFIKEKMFKNIQYWARTAAPLQETLWFIQYLIQRSKKVNSGESIISTLAVLYERYFIENDSCRPNNLKLH